MNTLWRKAVRDLCGERGRSASIVLALTLGVAGFLAVLSAYAILVRALNDGFLAANPASATLAIGRLDQAFVEVARELPGVQDAEARRSVRGRIRTGPGQWRNLVLFARADFAASRIGTVAPEAGDWPPGPDELALERDALQVAAAQIGDVVVVRTVAGSERSLRVSGSVHDVGQAQARMENLVYGYVTPETLSLLGESPGYDTLAIRVAERPLDESHIREVASSVATASEVRGQPVLRIDVPEPGQHPHAKIMGLLLLSMAAFGLLILALAGTIVFNVLTALLAGQARQIGVMRAIGGTRLQIARVYLLEAGLLGAAATALAVPVGLLGGRWLCSWLAVFLNFDVASFAVPIWIYVLVFAVGIAVPTIAALIPVWLATRVPVRESLAATGPSRRSYGSSALDRALAKLGGSRRELALAIRNATRNRLRVALTLVTLSAAGVFFMSALNVRQSLIATLDRLFAAQRADLVVSLSGDYPSDVVERAARSAESVADAEGWRVVDARLRRAQEVAGPAPEDFSLVGVPERSRLMAFDLASGAGLDGKPNGIVLNTELFERMGRPAIGAEVRLYVAGAETAFHLAGVAREPYSPPAAYVSRGSLASGPAAGSVNSLRIALLSRDPAALDAVRTSLERALERSGAHVLQVTTKTERRFVYDQHMVMIYVFLLVVASILACVGGLGLLTTVSLNVLERRREIGVLRAIGATPRAIRRIVVIEAVTVGLVAWSIAVLAAPPLGKWIGDLLMGSMFRATSDIAVAVDLAGVFVWLAVALAGSALASSLLARQAARLSVREALAYE